MDGFTIISWAIFIFSYPIYHKYLLEYINKKNNYLKKEIEEIVRTEIINKESIYKQTESNFRQGFNKKIKENEEYLKGIIDTSHKQFNNNILEVNKKLDIFKNIEKEFEKISNFYKLVEKLNIDIEKKDLRNKEFLEKVVKLYEELCIQIEKLNNDSIRFNEFIDGIKILVHRNAT